MSWYRATRDVALGTAGPWKPGQVVNISDAQAASVNDRLLGALASCPAPRPPEPEPDVKPWLAKPEPERAEKPKPSKPTRKAVKRG